MKNTMLKFTATLTVACAMLISGCGKKEYQKMEFAEAYSGLNGREIPAKVDIVIVADNTGSMNSALANVESQISGFVSSLQAHNWDYRVAKLTIANPSPITKVLVNPSYNSATLPDGTPNPSLDLVPAQYTMSGTSELLPLVSNIVMTSEDYTYSNTINAISAATNSVPIGPSNPTYYAGKSASSTIQSFSGKVLRKDAMLAVIVLTNGTEFSVDPTGRGVIDYNKLSTYASQLKALRNSANLVRFYPIAANQYNGGNQCLGASSYYGGSYREMITTGRMSGIATNVCDASALGSVMSAIEGDLTNVAQKFVRSYIVLEHEPVVSSIQVFKNGVQIPQGSVNGWTYEGGPQTVNTITGILDSQTGNVIPFSADSKTGWVIKLNGTAQLYGNDLPTVNYNRP